MVAETSAAAVLAVELAVLAELEEVVAVAFVVGVAV